MISIYDLKQQIDIVDVIESYTELKKIGSNFQAVSNPLRHDEHPNFIISPSKQIWKDFATDDGGDVIDFIKEAEKLNITEAISFLAENYLGIDATQSSPPQHKYRTLPKPKTVDQTIEEENYLISNLEQKAEQCLNAFQGKKYLAFTLDIEGGINNQSMIKVSQIFEKLFESQLIPADEKFARYLFDKIIGYDKYFNCPMLIVRNEEEKVVDLVRYRPERDGISLKQKYLVAKNTIKPHKRGRHFIFPFQQQMMKISHKEGYCFIGEGLKNAVNASLGGIPFISIESASSISDKLIDFLTGQRMKDIVLIGALDGDAAGEVAYHKIKNKIQLSKNMFDFKSGTDFTDYLKDIREETLHGSKKAS